MRNILKHINRIRSFSLKLSGAILMVSCLSPIDFQTDFYGNRLVVSGQVSPIPDQNFVQLGMTANTDRLPFPLSGAIVDLYDDAGNVYRYQEDEFNPGTYVINGFSGVESTSYFIRIEAEGKTYESTPEKMPADAGQITSYLDYQMEDVTDIEGIVTSQPFVKIFANAILPETSDDVFIKWNVDEAFLLSPTDFPDPFGSVPPACFVIQNADPQRITLFNGEEVKSRSVEGFLVGSRIIDWSFNEKHYITTYQTSLTKEAYEYWRKVNILANQVGSIFDTPPAEITGNIRNINNASEKVLGYFQASNQTFYRTFLFKSDAPFPVATSTCTYDNRNFQDYPARCLDCRSVRNSTYSRPDWF